MSNGEKEMFILTSESVERLTINVGVLSEQEIEDCKREIQRGKVYVQYLKMKRGIKSAGKDKEATDDFQEVESFILDVKRFTEERETEIDSVINHLKDLLRIEGLGITEEKRLEVAKAVGLSKGHWFKCPKNHIYVIGVCGGASQKGRCPECKSDIGGVQHRLADGNKVTPETDGASFAAYSEKADNMPVTKF